MSERMNEWLQLIGLIKWEFLLHSAKWTTTVKCDDFKYASKMFRFSSIQIYKFHITKNPLNFSLVFLLIDGVNIRVVCTQTN